MSKYGAGKFVQESYNKNNSLGIKILTKYLIKKGFINITSEENYSHDVVAEKNGKKYYFEVEMKNGYPFSSKETFRFPTVSFLGRKKKMHDKEQFKYVIICGETSWGIGCDSSIIFNDKYIEELDINTSDRHGRDLFYRVPKDECSFFDLNI